MIADWIIGSVPPWAWLILALVIAAIIITALRGGGWKWALAAAAAGVMAYLQAKSYHRGAAVERGKQDAADQKARDVIAEKKEDIRTASPKEKDERFNRWTKPS